MSSAGEVALDLIVFENHRFQRRFHQLGYTRGFHIFISTIVHVIDVNFQKWYSSPFSTTTEGFILTPIISSTLASGALTTAEVWGEEGGWVGLWHHVQNLDWKGRGLVWACSSLLTSSSNLFLG
jgi:hypothetical protein